MSLRSIWKDLEKNSKFPVSSSVFPLCLLWWRWTVLMHYLQSCWECPRTKGRPCGQESCCCRATEQSRAATASHGTTAVQAQLRLWGGTELFFLEGIQYSWSKIFLKGTKKHKGSAPSFNNSNFPLFPLFPGPAYRSYINYDPLSSAKQASPAFFQSCPLIIHFLSYSMLQLSPLLKSGTTLSSSKLTTSNTSQENAFRSAPSLKSTLIPCP